MGALDVQSRSNLDSVLAMQIRRDPTDVTELGALLAKLPLSPKFAKMLVVSTNCFEFKDAIKLEDKVRFLCEKRPTQGPLYRSVPRVQTSP